MIYKIIILVATLCATEIVGEEDLPFRFDYTYNKEAGGWLKFHRIPSPWNDAKIRCHAEGAILASPLDIQLKKQILGFVAKEPITAIFTGVHATFSNGDFASVEGVPLSRLHITWADGEPKGKTNCLAMMTEGGTMANVQCNDALSYVCYKKQVDLLQTDCGTSDPDYLRPCKSLTEYKLDARTGKCYKFHRRGLSWSKAYMTCAAEGGYLVIINSEEEHNILKELYAAVKDEDIFSKNPGTCHIGFRDLRDGGSWLTIHGQTLKEAGFNRWSGGQPDNSTHPCPEGEACGNILRNGLLNDIWCGWVSPFICEKSPDSLK